MRKILTSLLLSPQLWLVISLGTANGCGRFYGDPASLKSSMGDRKQLRVATVSGVWTRQQSQGMSWGLESDLLQDFAQSTGVTLKYKVFANAERARQSLLAGDVDVLALHASGHVADGAQAGPSYGEAELALVCPKTLNGNNPPILISDRHDNDDLREELKDRRWTQIRSVPWPLAKIFQKISTSESCAVTEISEAQSEIRAYPDLRITDLPLSKQTFRMWISRQDPKITQALFYWQQKIAQDGTLSRIRDRYHLPLNALTPADLKYLLARQDELKIYKSLFVDSSNEHGLPWALTAAVSFQESHWKMEARSYTGVRGLMMLTEDTAKHVGIANRVDPEQSIWGGAKYLRFLWDMFPKSLANRERLALTLAAYNVGFGHLRDAQKLAIQRRLDPYAWRDLRQVLPLLSDPNIAENLEFGVARGQEPVHFTERSLAYFDLIQTLRP